MDDNRKRSNLILGAVLISAGVLFFIGRFLGFNGWDSLWPLIIILIGGAFFVGMVLGGKQVGGLAIPGSIIITIGLILLVQNWFGIYETWAYAWTLIIASVGIGLAIFGAWSSNPEMSRSGWSLVRLGLLLFVIFGALFELIFNFTGLRDRGGQLFWPLILILAGTLLFFYRGYRLLTTRTKLNWEERDLFWPVLIAGAGVLWLLINLGRLPFVNVSALLGLWPILLIAGGLDLILGRKLPWLGALLGLALVAVILWAAFNAERLELKRTFSWPFEEISSMNERVTGSGNVVEESRNLTGYDRISFAAGGAAQVVQGDREGLTVSADENLLEYLTTEVRGGELIIRVSPGYSLSPSQPIRYVIYVRELEGISVSGSGEILVESLDSDRMTISFSGLGKLDLRDLQAQELKVDISGSGSGVVGGKIDELDLEISGLGNFEAGDLQTHQARVGISGQGKTVIWVSDQLEVKISGSGSVSYYGDPEITQEISGSGGIEKLGLK